MTTMTPALPLLPRGCGSPKKGGTYMSVGTAANGIPLWTFLIDPTVPITDLKDFGVSAIGTVIKARTNSDVKDAYDWIGASNYPNPADWITEVGTLGYHQKVDPRILAQLTEKSVVFHIHSRAWANPVPFYADRMANPPKCTKPEHNHPEAGTEVFCARLLWENLVEGIPNVDRRSVHRSMPAFEYDGWSSPSDDTEFTPALFFYMPVSLMNIKIYEDDSPEKKHEKSYDTVAKTIFKDRVEVVKLEE